MAEIDYEAIAKKMGAVDYEAVARSMGGKILDNASQTASNTDPTIVDRAKSYGNAMLTGAKYGGPLGAGIAASMEGSKLLSEAAYGLGGRVTDSAAQLGASPKASALAGLAANVGLEAIPAFLGGGIVGKAASPQLQDSGRRWMQSAVKPLIEDLENGSAKKAIQTMLDKGLNVTQGGMETLRTKISELNREVASTIKNSTATIDQKQAVYQPIKDAIDYFSRQVNPTASKEAITKAWDEFLRVFPGSSMPVQEAQAIKQGTYKILSNSYAGEVGTASEAAQKALARGLKEGVADAVPQVRALNAQESELINTLNVVERRVLLAANKNPLGLAALASSPTRFLEMMADKSELFKSLVARMLYSGSERIPQAVAGTGIAATQGLIQNQGR